MCEHEAIFPNQTERDEIYTEILLSPLKKSASYLPKMGTSGDVNLNVFTRLYSSDPLYHWIGLDSPLVFAAHKAAGGITSIYRQLGIGAERLFRQILRDELGLTAGQVTWSYEVFPEIDGTENILEPKPRILSLDGRVTIGDVSDIVAQNRLQSWLAKQCLRLDITASLKGAVFEVRQGYKSADSKRQNADLANAAQALGHGYLPVLTIMSTQINEAVLARYTTGNWCVLTGELGRKDASHSTFDFLNQVIGYNLADFFERNTGRLRSNVEAILQKLLEAK